MEETKDGFSSNECDAMDEINFYRLKLQADRKRYMDLEMNIFRTRLLKNKAVFVRDNVNKENEELDRQLKDIHVNYVKTVKEATRSLDLEIAIREKVAKLIEQRDQLKREYLELQTYASENSSKLREVKMMIIEQEKKNAPLLRKLKRKSEDASIPEDIKAKMLKILTSVNLKKEELYEMSTSFHPI